MNKAISLLADFFGQSVEKFQAFAMLQHRGYRGPTPARRTRIPGAPGRAGVKLAKLAAKRRLVGR